MKLNKFNGHLLWALLAGAALVLPFSLQAVANDYSACAGLNDYLSYSKCVAEIDSKNSGQPTALVEDVKAVDGDFSIKINDGSGKTNSLSVVLYLKASAATTQMALSKDSNFGFAERQAFAAQQAWTLDDLPDATQYVYVKFFDKDDNALKTVAASIIYSSRVIDAKAETAAKTQYVKIYGKSLDAQIAFDRQWLDIAAYGLAKDTPRELDKEKEALSKFIKVYKKTPKNGQDWQLLNAIAYADTDGAASAAAPTTDTGSAAPSAAAACVAKPFKQILDVGSKGAEVKALQQLLICAGYLADTAKTDGNFTKETEDGVKQFQEKYELKCKDGSYCGRFGPATAKKLVGIYKEGNSEPAAASPAAEPAAKAILKLSRNLTVGSQGTDVKNLQTYLAQDSELYPEGAASGKFDAATEEAVKKFQEKYELKCKDGTYCGYVGPATRAKLQEVSDN